MKPGALIPLIVAFAACAAPVSPVEAPDSGEDAGSPDTGFSDFDGGLATDAGPALDAGTQSDSGTSTDAGSSEDAGHHEDAGHEEDAGHREDAGSVSDAGQSDAGRSSGDGGVISCNPATTAEFTNTCLAAAFACFMPTGSCTVDTQIGIDTSHTTYSWTDGTTINETGGPDAPFSFSVDNSGDQTCALVDPVFSGTTCGSNARAFSITNASGQVLATICWNTSGPSTVSCADGTVLTLENNDQNRVPDCLPVAPALAQCVPAQMCAPDAGPSPFCCQSNGNSCEKNSDCCSDNCIMRGSPGFCCEPGGCP